MMDIPTVANELYGLSLGEFTVTRNARAKEAKASGDKALAEAITTLPKPTAAAWVVNMLVRHHVDVVEQVLTLGESLRAASDHLDGEELRTLNRQRRQLTAAVTTQARGLARELGHPVTEAVATQVEETLRTAMTDPDAASAVRTGLLVRPLSATGFGPVDLAGAAAVPAASDVLPTTDAGPSPAGPESPTPSRSPDLRLVQNAQADRAKAAEAARAAKVAEATAAAKDAEATLAKAQKSAKKVSRRFAELEARALQVGSELEEVRRQAAELEHAAETAQDELDEATAIVEARDQDVSVAADAARRASERLEAISSTAGREDVKS